MKLPIISGLSPSKWLFAKRAKPGAKALVRRSLNLGGDGDEIELAENFERAFALKFTNAELENCHTVGDMDELVWQKLRNRYGQNARYMSAMTFYALRRVLRQHAGGVRIAPSTPLGELPISPKLLVKLLEKQEGLRTHFIPGYLANIGWLLQIGWLVLFLGPGDWAISSLAAIILGIVAIGLDQGAFPRGETVGEMSKRMARQNFGTLADKGGRVSRQSVWEAIRQVAADFQSFRLEEIGRETSFFPSLSSRERSR